MEWSSENTTVKPLGSVEISYCSFGGRTAAAAVSFSLAIDRSNVGVSLRRTSDQNRGYQQAAVTATVSSGTSAFSAACTVSGIHG